MYPAVLHLNKQKETVRDELFLLVKLWRFSATFIDSVSFYFCSVSQWNVVKMNVRHWVDEPQRPRIGGFCRPKGKFPLIICWRKVSTIVQALQWSRHSYRFMQKINAWLFSLTKTVQSHSHFFISINDESLERRKVTLSLSLFVKWISWETERWIILLKKSQVFLRHLS